MTECYVILEFPSPLSYADGTPGTNKRGWLPATDPREITLAIRAGAEFVGVAVDGGGSAGDDGEKKGESNGIR